MQRFLNKSEMLANLSVEEVPFCQKAKYSCLLCPEFSLFDLSLPKKVRRELLAQSKPEKSPKSIPVVVLITSKHTQDILNTYYLQAHCCINETLNLK